MSDSFSVADDEQPPASDEASSRTRVAPVLVLSAGIVLAAIVAIVLIVIFLRPASSLAIFDREPTEAEVSLSALVNEGVLGGDAEARILAESPTATVVAFRTDSLSIESSGTVCVAVVEFDVASGTTCMGIDDFTTGGMDVTVRGRTGVFGLDWGPEGDAQVSLPDDGDRDPSGG